MKKGQLFTSDAIVAVAALLMIIGITMYLHDSLAGSIQTSVIYHQIENTAEMNANKIYENLTQFSVFDSSKTMNLFARAYSQIDAEYKFGYNFTVEVRKMDDSIYSLNGVNLSIGSAPSRVRFSVNTERLGILESTDVKLIVRVYKT